MPLDPSKIRSRREALNLTQAQAAERALMPQGNWSRIEGGDRTDPRLSTAETVAVALKCRLEDLLLPTRKS